MRVELAGGEVFDLGETEATPTISIIDYSRRETDDFGVTTVVERGFSRRLSTRIVLPIGAVDALQRRLASLRATAARWVADDSQSWLSVNGFYKDFSLDLAVPPISYCTLTVEGLAGSEAFVDTGIDPAPLGQASTLRLLQPQILTTAMLTASSIVEADHPEWSLGATYGMGARVIKASLHRIFESVVAGNIGHDPAEPSGHWIDVGPTNRWAMFDQALGTSTTAAGSIAVTIDPVAAINAIALLDVVATSVRVQADGYDRTVVPASLPGMALFLDLPLSGTPVTITVTGSGTVSVGTLLFGRLVGLGLSEASPSAGITDFSRKDVDEFGEVEVVERAWAKRMAISGRLRTDAIDVVAGRVAAVRAKPSLWIGDDGLEAITVYGFFREFSIEVGVGVSRVSLSIEGLSTAAPPPGPLVDLSALEALVEEAQRTADSKRTLFTQMTAPGAAESEENDWWNQVDANGAIVATYVRVAGNGNIGIGGSEITIGGAPVSLCWRLIEDQRIGGALAAAAGAFALADGKAEIFTMFNATDPVPTGINVGDILIRAYLSSTQVDHWAGASWQAAATYGATVAQIQATTDARAAADAALANLAEIASDNLLTPSEKPRLVQDNAVILSQQPGIDAQAAAFGLTALKATYDGAIAALSAHLAILTTPVLWSNLGGNTVIDGPTFWAKFKAVYDARDALLTAFSNIAATRADWDKVVGVPDALTDGRVEEALNPDGSIKPGKVVYQSMSADTLNEVVSATATNIDPTATGQEILRISGLDVLPSQGGYAHMILSADVGRLAGAQWNGPSPEDCICYAWLQRSPAGVNSWTHLYSRILYLNKSAQTSFSSGSGTVFLTFIAGPRLSATAQFVDTPLSDGSYDYRWVAAQVASPGDLAGSSSTAARVFNAQAIAISVKVAA